MPKWKIIAYWVFDWFVYPLISWALPESRKRKQDSQDGRDA